MSSKKPKITSQTESQLTSAISSNQFSRKLKLYHEDFTKKQKSFIDKALSDSLNMMFVQGPAGTTKTYLSIYCGLKMLSDQKVEQLIYVRSAVESADQLVPGEVGGKLVEVVASYIRLETTGIQYAAHGDVRLASKTCRLDVKVGRLIGEVGQ